MADFDALAQAERILSAAKDGDQKAVINTQLILQILALTATTATIATTVTGAPIATTETATVTVTTAGGTRTATLPVVTTTTVGSATTEEIVSAGMATEIETGEIVTAAATTTGPRVTVTMVGAGSVMTSFESVSVAAAEAVVVDVAGAAEMNTELPSGVLRLRMVLSPSRSVSVERPGGTSSRLPDGVALTYVCVGMFNLPGANRTPLAPNILGMTGALPPIHYGQGSFAPGTAAPNLARQSRRLYVGNITYEANETNLQEFFNRKMVEMKIGTGQAGDPVIGVQINHEKSYAFVEFRSSEDATAAMAFDGIMFQAGPLKIRRPKDYTGSDLSAPMGVHVPGVVSTNVPDSINKIFVGGLPTYLDENQVMELLKSFGELKAFNLVRENGNGASKGFAFFEYVDPSVTDIATQGLNGMELGDRFLVVQRASIGAKPGMPGIPPEFFPPAMPRPIAPIGQDADPNPYKHTILLLLNMVAPEDLNDDGEYAEIVEDVREECSKYGDIRGLVIPRPAKKEKSKWDANAGALVTAGGVPLGAGSVGGNSETKSDEARGVGRVYIKFEDADGASAALRALAGRAFAGRSIIATLLADDADHTPPIHELFPNDVAPRE
ncbi:RNA recognition motif protein [Ceratobasidium sp. AG-Ba]|nr:RNA recognition motif protein [Ceratobasidium sp. AG-Ba]